MAAPIGLAIIAISPVALAGQEWDGGGGDDNWNTAANWTSNTLPAFSTLLEFSGSVRLTPYNNLTADTTIGGIAFGSDTGSGFTLSGNRITLGGDIRNYHTTKSQVIDLHLVLNATRSIITTTSTTITVNGVISGAHPLSIGTSSDAGFVVLKGANTFNQLQVSRGQVTVESIGNTGTAGPVGIGTVNLNGSSGNSTLRYIGTGETNNRNFTLSSVIAGGTGWIDQSGTSGILALQGSIENSGGNRTLGLTGSGVGVSSGAITDGGTTLNLTKQGGGTWTLSGANTYDGITTVSDGTHVGIGANAFGSTSAIHLDGSAILSLRGDASTSFVKAAGGTAYNITVTSNGPEINVDRATESSTGARTMTIGNIGTTWSGTNYQINFTGANNSGVTVGAVTGSVQNAASTMTISNTNTGGTTTIASYTSANTSGGEVLTFIGNGNTTINGAITPSATILGVSKSGAGALTLNGTNTYAGKTTISGGTLQFGKKGSLYDGDTTSWTPENILASSGTTLALNVGGTDEFTAGDVNLLLGNISVATATSGLRSGATIGFDTTNATGGTFSQGNAITNSTGDGLGTIGVTKLGTNTLVLDKANTYTGVTTVTAGTLAINGDQSSATGNVNVSGTGTRLIGTGTVGGHTTINSGAIQSAGGAIADVGLQTFDKSGVATANLTYGAGSVFEWDLDANKDTDGYDHDSNGVTGNTNVGTRGTDFDAVDVTGTLTVDSTAIFRVVLGSNVDNDEFWETEQSWTNIFTAGSTSGGFSLLQVVDTSGATYVQSDLNTGYAFSVSGTTLTWSAIPEPSSALVGILIGAGMLRRRRNLQSARF